MATIAPTKTLKFDEDVIAVLRHQVAWTDDGLSASMPQLDAGLYKKIKKAFQAMGGIWNRKADATLFTEDPRSRVAGLITSGALVVERDGFFPTPPEVTQKLLSYLHLGMGDYNWLEPEAGDGAMVKVLLEENFLPERIYCIEKNTRRCDDLRDLGVRVACGDFLKFCNSAHIPFHRIIMNPPFEKQQDILHVLKAYHVLAERGVMGAILSEGAFFHDTAIANEFRRWLKSVGAHEEKLPDGSFKDSGTMVNTRFIIIHK